MTLFEHEMGGGDDGNRTRVRGFADRTSGSDAYRSVPTSEASEAEMSDESQSVPMRTDAVNGHKWSNPRRQRRRPPGTGMLRLRDDGRWEEAA